MTADGHPEAWTEHAHQRRGQDWAWRSALLALFLAALALRLQNLDLSPWGDEAYYFFITHNLSAFWNTSAYPVSGSVSPVFPLAYHLFAVNLESVRATNAVVGASAVPLGMLVMRELGTGLGVSLVGGALLAVNAILIQFSGLVFLDMLGAAIALAAVLAYVHGWFGAAAVLVAIAVLEKDYYAILGLALAVDRLIAGRRLYLELALAAIPVFGWLALRYGLMRSSLHYMLVEHAHVALTLGGLDQAVGSLALLPLAIASIFLSARLRSSALYVGTFLLAQALWGNAQPWYWCLSVILVTLLAAHGVTLLLAASRRRGLVLGIVTVLVLTAFLAEARSSIRYLTTWHSRDLDRVAAYLDGQPVQPVSLVACGWSYQYYPLGASSRPAESVDGWGSATTRLAVACAGAPLAPGEWKPLYKVGPYTVLER